MKLAIFLFASALAAQQLDTDRPAAASAVVEPARLTAGGQGTLKVTLKIVEGGHANSNITADPNLVATSFTPKPAAGIAWGRPRYPEPQSVREWYSADPLSVFVDGAVIVVPFTVDAGAAGAIALNGLLTIQVCDHDQCYPAARVPVTAQLQVQGKAKP
jgi:hypothetical protein